MMPEMPSMAARQAVAAASEAAGAVPAEQEKAVPTAEPTKKAKAKGRGGKSAWKAKRLGLPTVDELLESGVLSMSPKPAPDQPLWQGLIGDIPTGDTPTHAIPVDPGCVEAEGGARASQA